jgi:hypothetical protein
VASNARPAFLREQGRRFDQVYHAASLWVPASDSTGDFQVVRCPNDDRIAPVFQVAQHAALKPALCVPQAAMRCAPRRQAEKSGLDFSKPCGKGGDRHLYDNQRMALLELALRWQGFILVRKYQEIQFVAWRAR